MKKELKVKDSDFEKMEKVYTPRNKYVSRGFHLYFSYGVRIFFMFFAILVIAVISYMNYINSFSKSSSVSLPYETSGAIDYKVSLLPGNPFETGNLNAVNTYIADYIDDVSTDFLFDYELEEKSDIKYTYYVDATMELKSDKDGSVLSRKVDKLIPEVKKEEKDTDKLDLKQNVNLDYNHYNNLAKEISKSVRDEHGIDITGNLFLELHIDIQVRNKDFKNVINESKVIKVEIPLLSAQVKAFMVDNINEKDVYTEYEASKLISKSSLFVAISLWIVDIIFLLLVCSFILKSTPKKTSYMRIRNSLLRDHDGVIVNSKNDPDFKGYNVINCATFEELMDAQKVLNKPIIYNELVKNQKAMFIIVSGNDVYKYVLKEADIEYYN